MAASVALRGYTFAHQTHGSQLASVPVGLNVRGSNTSRQHGEWKAGAFQASSHIRWPTELPGVTRWAINSFPDALEVSAPALTAVNQDGTQMAVLRGWMVCLYELSSRRLLRVITCSQPEVAYTQISWHPDGDFLTLVRNDHVVELQPIVEGKEHSEFAAQQEAISRIEWSPDAGYLAMVVGKSVRVLSADGFEELQGPVHGSGVTELAWRPDGKVLLSVDRGAFWSWDLTDGTQQKLPKRQEMRYLSWAPDGSKFAAYSASGEGGTISIITPKGNELHAWQNTVTRGTTDIYWNSETGNIQTAGIGGDSAFWDESQQVVDRVTMPIQQYRRAYWAANGKLLVCEARDAIVDYRHLESLHGARIERPRIGSVSCASSGDTVALGMSGGEIRFMTPDLKLKKSVHSKSGQVMYVKFSPDGSMLAARSFGRKELEIWSPSGELLHEFEGQGNAIVKFAWSPDGKQLVTASKDKVIRVWDMKGELVQRIPVTEDIVALAWAPHKMIAVQGNRGAVKLLDFEEEVFHNLKTWSKGQLAWRPGTDDLLIGTGQAWTIGNRNLREVAHVPRRGFAKNLLTRWSRNGSKLLWTNAGQFGVSSITEPQLTSENVLNAWRAIVDVNGTMVVDAAWSPDEERLHLVSFGDLLVYNAETAQLQAVYMPLLNGEMLVLSAAGQIMNGQPEDYSGEIFYTVEWDDGGRSALTPDEFYSRFALPR